MQKFFMLAALLAGSSNMFGALVSCSPNNGDLSAGPVTFSCGGQGVGGDNIVYDTLSIYVIANGNVTGPANIAGTTFSSTVSNTANSAGYNLVGNIGLSCVAGAINNLAGCTAPTGSNSSLTNLANLDVIGGFTVTLSATGTLPSSASLAYDVTSVNTSGVPEPSTFALLGSALVGLGMMARRRS